MTAKLALWPSAGSPLPRGRTAERAVDSIHVRPRGSGDPGQRALALTKRDIFRALAAGLAFGAILTTGFTAMAAWQCGGVCLPEVIDNAMLSFAAGILGLGPVAAYGRR